MIAAALTLSLGSLLADLPPEIDPASLPAEGSGPQLIEAVFVAGPRYRFDVGPVAVETDVRWYATTTEPEDGAPLVEIRRWPGDSVIAFYAIAGEMSDSGPSRLVPEGRFEMVTPGRFRGTVRTDEGTRAALWLERPVPERSERLAALLIPGDAGLGPSAVPTVTEELVAVFDRAEIRVNAWDAVTSLGRGQTVRVPDLPPPPDACDERKDPWQIADGGAFTMGLPPGIRAVRLETGARPPRPIPGALLWLRGRFTDRNGEGVAVGDERRAGYVILTPAAPATSIAKRPPTATPGATYVDGLDLDAVVLEDTTARAGRVERWNEPGFEGTWLVFRLAWTDREVEIGLPVVENRRSLALFWMPATLRPEGFPPAPPPIDPAERFGIRFERAGPAERKRRPLFEGVLVAPGFRMELPRGVFPVASLRTADGFPVTLVAPDGRRFGLIRRIEADRVAAEATARPGWELPRRPGARNVQGAWRHSSGARLYAPPGGDGWILEPVGSIQSETDSVLWERLVNAVELQRPRRSRDEDASAPD